MFSSGCDDDDDDECCWCRIECGGGGVFSSGCDDDGEFHAGSRMLHLLNVRMCQCSQSTPPPPASHATAAAADAATDNLTVTMETLCPTELNTCHYNTLTSTCIDI